MSSLLSSRTYSLTYVRIECDEMPKQGRFPGHIGTLCSTFLLETIVCTIDHDATSRVHNDASTYRVGSRWHLLFVEMPSIQQDCPESQSLHSDTFEI